MTIELTLVNNDKIIIKDVDYISFCEKWGMWSEGVLYVKHIEQTEFGERIVADIIKQSLIVTFDISKH